MTCGYNIVVLYDVWMSVCLFTHRCCIMFIVNMCLNCFFCFWIVWYCCNTHHVELLCIVRRANMWVSCTWCCAYGLCLVVCVWLGCVFVFVSVWCVWMEFGYECCCTIIWCGVCVGLGICLCCVVGVYVFVYEHVCVNYMCIWCWMCWWWTNTCCCVLVCCWCCWFVFVFMFVFFFLWFVATFVGVIGVVFDTWLCNHVVWHNLLLCIMWLLNVAVCVCVCWCCVVDCMVLQLYELLLLYLYVGSVMHACCIDMCWCYCVCWFTWLVTCRYTHNCKYVLCVVCVLFDCELCLHIGHVYMLFDCCVVVVVA